MKDPIAMGRSRRRLLRQRQRATHHAVNSGDHRYDSVEPVVPVAAFDLDDREFTIAVPFATVEKGQPIGRGMPMSLLLDNRQGRPIEAAKFWLEPGADRVVLEWSVAVTDTDWDTGADQRPLQDVIDAFCVAMYTGRPIDPVSGVRFYPRFAFTTEREDGTEVPFNPGGGRG